MPSWVQNAVFYQVFPDRFHRSGRVKSKLPFEPWDAPQTPLGFKGGDLHGLTEKLDHLSDLGVNAIYLNPIFTSCANHRYHTYDYSQVDPLLGGDPALRELLDTAHARGIRVVLDGVFNHCSRGFFQFNHLLENGEASPYRGWFHVKGWPLNPYPRPGEATNYDCWWGLPALPKFNTAHPEVRKLIFDCAVHWLRFGIDGWRLDVPFEIDDDDFWREFRHVCKGVNPDCYLVGEIWQDARRWLKGDMFDATMNYLLPMLTMRYFAGSKLKVTHGYGGHEMTPLDDAGFKDGIQKLAALYKPETALRLMNTLSSHDTDRMLTAYGGDEKLMRLGLVFGFLFPGAPSVYYGEEVGLTGELEAGTRQGMPWDEARWNSGLLSLYRRLIRLRRTKPVLTSGRFRLLEVFDAPGAAAYEREDAKGRIVVAVNKSAEPRVVRLQQLRDRECRPNELLYSTAHALTFDPGLTLTLEPQGYSVMECR